MKLLGRYLLGQILAASLFVLLGLMVLFAFFDVLQELGSLGRNQYGLAQIGIVVALSLPGHLVEILPVSVLIGTLFGLSRLAGNSEYAVMRVSGLSNGRMAAWFALAGCVLALGVGLLGETLAPWSEQAAQRYKLSATRSVVAQQFRSGLWIKDNGDFVNVREVMPDSSLRQIEIYSFDAQGALKSLRSAQNAQWVRGQEWQLNGVNETRFSPGGTTAHPISTQTWRSVLTPDILSVLLIAPEKMSTRTLWRYVTHLRDNGQSAARYELALWTKFLSPLVIPVMMVLAMPFALHNPRQGHTGRRIFLGILAGLGFHLLSRLSGHLGLLNDWPAMLVASLPLLVFLAAALLSLRWLDRR